MNDEMSTTKEIIWEEKNLIEPQKKFENSGESGVCDTTIDTNEKLENKILKDITKTKKITSGIYKIINKINGKYYIGSSKNIFKRWANHKSLLNRNIHNNNHLQKSYNKHGKENFDFIIIEIISKEKLIDVEQKYLDMCEFDKNKCYNIAKLAISSRMGILRSESSKIKQSISMRGKYTGNNHPLFGKHHSQETKEKIKNSNSRKYEEIYGVEKSKEKKDKQSIMWSGKNNPMYNKHHTLDAKLKISKYRIGKKHSDKTKEKIGKYSRDKTIFSLKNTKTHELFIGTKHEFIVKYYNGKRNYRIYCIFNKNKSYKGWILNI